MRMNVGVAVDFSKRIQAKPEVLACKIALSDYMAKINPKHATYSQRNLRNVYRQVCRCKYVPGNMNFFIDNGFIYIFEETSSDFHYELLMLELIRDIF